MWRYQLLQACLITGLCLGACEGVPVPNSSPSPGEKPSEVGTISTVVGTGESGFSGDGGPAREAEIDFPRGLAFDPEGNLYFSDYWNHRIRKVDKHGTISTVLYNYVPNRPKIGAYALTFDPEGSLYIANDDYVIRKVDPSGNVSVFAGGHNVYPGVYPGGVSDSSTEPAPSPSPPAPGSEGEAIGDGGPATLAAVSANDLDVDQGENLFISDYLYNRIRKVDRNGIITTIAGSGPVTPLPVTPGVDYFSGNEGPAMAAMLYGISGIALGQRGRLFIAADNRLLMLDAGGAIHTLAGNGEGRFSGDGGPAKDATVAIGSIAVDTQGNLYGTEPFGNRIRRIDTSGIITTIAGTGEYGFSGDGGPATQAKLRHPYSIGIGPDGNLYFVDLDNNRIRKVILVDGE